MLWFLKSQWVASKACLGRQIPTFMKDTWNMEARALSFLMGKKFNSLEESGWLEQILKTKYSEVSQNRHSEGLWWWLSPVPSGGHTPVTCRLPVTSCYITCLLLTGSNQQYFNPITTLGVGQQEQYFSCDSSFFTFTVLSFCKCIKCVCLFFLLKKRI